MLRIVIAVRSAAAVLQLWWAMSWPDKMTILWTMKSTPPEWREPLAEAAVRAIKSAAIGLDTDDLETNYRND